MGVLSVEPCLQPLFCGYFYPVWLRSFYFILPAIAGMAGIPYQDKLFVEMASHELFARACLELGSF
jgi:uncharacterized membrane protein